MAHALYHPHNGEKNGFDYQKADSLERLLTQIGGEDEIILAGGTELLVKIRQGIVCHVRLWDISELDELRFIRNGDEIISIGSATTMNEIAVSGLVHEFAPILAEAAENIGSPQIRNRATIGGNIAIASPVSDTLTPLLALDATVNVRSAGGSRRLHIPQLIRSYRQTDLQPGEILYQIDIPKQKAPHRSRFIKVGRRRAQAVSVINLAVVLVPDAEGRRIQDIRIALGGAGPTVLQAHRAEDYLKSQVLSDDTIERASELAALDTRPIDDIRGSKEGRYALIRAHVREALRGFKISENRL
jgi:carbon-monoxide dehydrogenase medium subunit